MALRADEPYKVLAIRITLGDLIAYISRTLALSLDLQTERAL